MPPAEEAPRFCPGPPAWQSPVVSSGRACRKVSLPGIAHCHVLLVSAPVPGRTADCLIKVVRSAPAACRAQLLCVEISCQSINQTCTQLALAERAEGLSRRRRLRCYWRWQPTCAPAASWTAPSGRRASRAPSSTRRCGACVARCGQSARRRCWPTTGWPWWVLRHALSSRLISPPSVDPWVLGYASCKHHFFGAPQVSCCWGTASAPSCRRFDPLWARLPIPCAAEARCGAAAVEGGLLPAHRGVQVRCLGTQRGWEAGVTGVAGWMPE